jgi:hypothetical protein
MEKPINNCEGLDKRTKEYKSCHEKYIKKLEAYNKLIDKNKDIGLGDAVESVLNSKAIKPITDTVKKMIWKDGEDCGCDERKEKLNKISLFRFSKVKCLTEQEYDILSKYYGDGNKPKRFSEIDKLNLVPIYNRILGFKLDTRTSCSECLITVNNSLHLLYTNYEPKK